MQFRIDARHANLWLSKHYVGSEKVNCWSLEGNYITIQRLLENTWCVILSLMVYFIMLSWKKVFNVVKFNLSNTMDKAKNMQWRLSHVLRGLQKPTKPNLSSKSLREFVLLSSWAYFDSVIDWSWVNPIMQCVAEPCGQTAVYIRALISLPGEQLQI